MHENNNNDNNKINQNTNKHGNLMTSVDSISHESSTHNSPKSVSSLLSISSNNSSSNSSYKHPIIRQPTPVYGTSQINPPTKTNINRIPPLEISPINCINRHASHINNNNNINNNGKQQQSLKTNLEILTQKFQQQNQINNYCNVYQYSQSHNQFTNNHNSQILIAVPSSNATYHFPVSLM